MGGMKLRLCIALAAVATCAAAAPAGAVIGGEPLEAKDVPWFTSVSGCGGTLVAPDRLLTAAHCVGGIAPGDMAPTAVNGEPRTITHVAMHPGYRHTNGHNYLDDVAIAQLDQPVTSVAPVTLGDSREHARIIGFGNIFAPGTGHSEADMLKGGLHQATLRQVSDADCAAVYKTNIPGTGERFNAARMRCAADIDGKQPLNSGCFGDSGGALVVGTNEAPVQLGVVSWGGDRCGADHSPSVFADTVRYRDFILDPTPTWGPTQGSAVTIKGSKSLRCSVAKREPGTKITYVWKHRGHHKPLEAIGTGSTHKVTKREAGTRLSCFAYASNDGGEILAGSDSVMAVR
jgi:secreted trypsin-like serine protease